MSEQPNLAFETPRFDYDQLETQLAGYIPDPQKHPHDVPSIISIEEGIRAGRIGDVAGGGYLLKGDRVIHRDVMMKRFRNEHAQ
jgi:hypothetical protein